MTSETRTSVGRSCRSRRSVLLALLAVAFFSHGSSAAAAQDQAEAEVQIIRVPNAEHDVPVPNSEQEDCLDSVPEGGRNQPCARPTPDATPDPEPEAEPTFFERALHEATGYHMLIGFFVDQVDPGQMSLRFRHPEVSALAGTRLSPAQVRGRHMSLSGGVVFAHTYRPTPWLRLPEVRMYLGGGSIRDGGTSFASDANLQVTPDHTFTARFELGVGVQLPLGPVTPYAMIRGGRSRYAINVRIADGSLGALGSERLTGGVWEAGVEAGVETIVQGNIWLSLAYRRGLVGPTGNGAMLFLAIKPAN
ncbi:MAG: hypothetical protein GW913_00210 [Myxococcales bacterium]|nr:hypothetical protein [Myxococcales bacterium]